MGRGKHRASSQTLKTRLSHPDSGLMIERAPGLPGRVWHGQLYASGRAFPLARIRLTVKLIDRGEACVLGQHNILLVSRPQPTWSLQSVSGFKSVALRL